MLYVNPELKRLRALVDAARARLRLVIGYRRKYLESLVRQGEEEAGKIAQEYRQASTQREQEYAETAAALAEKQELSAAEAAEVSQLWRKLVKLFHPEMAVGEIRNPNIEIRNKFQKREAGKGEQVRRFRFSAFPFFRTCFGFRISTFGFFPARSASSRNCAACGLTLSWKSSACWRR